MSVPDKPADLVRIRDDLAVKTMTAAALGARVVELTEEVTRLREELVAERARLDWLEAQRDATLYVRDFVDGQSRQRARLTWLEGSKFRWNYGVTLREAIDEATKGEGTTP